MKTYLLAWNPKRWHWENLAGISQQVKSGKPVTVRWSCGKSKRIESGDRVFFIRLGNEPKGIFASGTVLVGSYEDKHWDTARAAEGAIDRFVEVRLDTLLDPETDTILPRDLLDAEPFSTMHWDTQMSGISIPVYVADELEKVWAQFSASSGFVLPEEVSEGEVICEGAVRRISVNAYERSPEARQRCIEHYGTSCFICGFSFGAAYGEVGEGFIHAHHLKQLSEVGEEYEVDPIRDLRPICPNCHAIIHKRKPAYTIEEVKAFLQKTRSGG
jgi:5-methylcytosine-specific restriction protein A